MILEILLAKHIVQNLNFDFWNIKTGIGKSQALALGIVNNVKAMIYKGVRNDFTKIVWGDSDWFF